jgi:hypothetical protein
MAGACIRIGHDWSHRVTVPAVADLRAALEGLARRERDARRSVADLEARLRRFEDVERPAYEAWLRLELGPLVTRVEESAAELRARQMLAERVWELVEDEGLHPREALWVVREAPPARARRDDTLSSEEIEARRRAKLERKRAERKQAKRARRSGSTDSHATNDPTADGGASGRRRLVALYRALARRLHPDSPTVLGALAPARRRTVWAEVQAAYTTGSVDRLLALSTWVDTVTTTGGDGDADTPAHAPVLSLAERHERLRALRRSARALEKRLAELANVPAWDFTSVTPGARRKLRQAALRRLETELGEAEVALADVDASLAEIGPPRPPRATPRSTRRR